MKIEASATEDPPLPCASDEILIERYRAGHSDAFTELVHRYECELHKYLRRHLGDAAVAEDVSQETFLQLHMKLGLYEKGQLFRPWLYTIAKHKAIDTIRKADVLRMMRLDAVTPTQREKVEGRESDPAEYLEKEEEQRRVQNALEDLPSHLRLVLVMKYYEELNYEEIAERLCMPVGTVKSRIHLAKNKLRTILSEARSSLEAQLAVPHSASPGSGALVAG